PMDHMVSYQIMGASPTSGTVSQDFILCFEDLLSQEPSDRDYNDLVVRVSAEMLPDQRWVPLNGVDSGNWTADGEPRWYNFPVPIGTTATANFLDDIGGDATVTLSGFIEVNAIQLGSSHSYRFEGSTLNLTGSPTSVARRITDFQGNHTFNVP